MLNAPLTVTNGFPLQMERSYASSRKTNSVSTASSISNPKETPAYQSRSNSYADRVSGVLG